MNKTLTINSIAAVLVLVLSVPAFAQDRTISVTGEAEIRVVPDEAVLTLGVETWNESLGTARAQNDEAVQRILALAKDYKIEPKHVQTDHIAIESKYDYDDNTHKQFLVGYFIRRTVGVTLRDLSKFDDFYIKAVEAGANQVHSVQFRTTELRKHRDKARALAIQAAREKADDLAKVLEQKVGKARSIGEGHSTAWSWYNSYWGGQRGVMTQNVIQNIGGGPSEIEGTFAPGQIAVSANVSVTFELE